MQDNNDSGDRLAYRLAAIIAFLFIIILTLINYLPIENPLVNTVRNVFSGLLGDATSALLAVIFSIAFLGFYQFERARRDSKQFATFLKDELRPMVSEITKRTTDTILEEIGSERDQRNKQFQTLAEELNTQSRQLLNMTNRIDQTVIQGDLQGIRRIDSAVQIISTTIPSFEEIKNKQDEVIREIKKSRPAVIIKLLDDIKSNLSREIEYLNTILSPVQLSELLNRIVGVINRIVRASEEQSIQQLIYQLNELNEAVREKSNKLEEAQRKIAELEVGREYVKHLTVQEMYYNMEHQVGKLSVDTKDVISLLEHQLSEDEIHQISAQLEKAVRSSLEELIAQLRKGTPK